MASPTNAPADERPGAVRFAPLNWALLAAAALAIVAGYVSLSGGSTVLAPLLLVLGYVVLIPLGIIV